MRFLVRGAAKTSTLQVCDSRASGAAEKKPVHATCRAEITVQIVIAKEERDTGQIVLGSSGGVGRQGRGHKIKHLRASIRDSRGASEISTRAKIAREQQGITVRESYVDSDVNLALAQNMHRGGGIIDVPKEIAAKPSRRKGMSRGLSRVGGAGR